MLLPISDPRPAFSSPLPSKRALPPAEPQMNFRPIRLIQLGLQLFKLRKRLRAIQSGKRKEHRARLIDWLTGDCQYISSRGSNLKP